MSERDYKLRDLVSRLGVLVFRRIRNWFKVGMENPPHPNSVQRIREMR